MRTIIVASLLILLAAVACATETEPVATTEPTATVASSLPTNTPTIDETLLSFLTCDRLLAKLEKRWGQAPGVIYSDDPLVSGNIMPGDLHQAPHA